MIPGVRRWSPPLEWTVHARIRARARVFCARYFVGGCEPERLPGLSRRTALKIKIGSSVGLFKERLLSRGGCMSQVIGFSSKLFSPKATLTTLTTVETIHISIPNPAWFPPYVPALQPADRHDERTSHRKHRAAHHQTTACVCLLPPRTYRAAHYRIPDQGRKNHTRVMKEDRIRHSRLPHTTRPIKVWVDVDHRIIKTVLYLKYNQRRSHSSKLSRNNRGGRSTAFDCPSAKITGKVKSL